VAIILNIKSKADESVRNVPHPANGRLVLGRGPDSAVPLEAPGISREHLEVQSEDSAVYLTDLSSNGTWLNGARMPPRRKCRVREGDFVELPGYEIRVQTAAGANGSSAGTATGFAPARLPAAHAAAPPSRSFIRSFTPLELFLLLLVAASAGLLGTYLLL
jgi:predicted component of type VI protein secretion system